LLNLEHVDPVAKTCVVREAFGYGQTALPRHEDRPEAVVEIVAAALDDRFARRGRDVNRDAPTKKSPFRPVDASGDQASATQLSNPLKPEAWKKLRMLSIDNDKTTQAFGEEAINLLFENSDRIVSALTQPQPHVDVSAPVAPAPKTINHNPTFGGKLVRPRSDARRSTNHVDGGDRETDG